MTTTEPLYYAEGRYIYRRPVDTSQPDGRVFVSLGFRCAVADENVGEEGAEAIAELMNRGETQSDLLATLEKTLAAYIGASKDFMAVDAKMDGHELATFMDDDAIVVQARAAIARATGKE